MKKFFLLTLLCVFISVLTSCQVREDLEFESNVFILPFRLSELILDEEIDPDTGEEIIPGVRVDETVIINEYDRFNEEYLTKFDFPEEYIELLGDTINEDFFLDSQLVVILRTSDYKTEFDVWGLFTKNNELHIEYDMELVEKVRTRTIILILMDIIPIEDSNVIFEYEIEPLPMGDFTTLFFTFMLTIVISVILFFIIRTVRQESYRLREIASVLIDGILSKNALYSFITNHIQKFGPDLPFPLFYVDLDYFDTNVEGLDDKQKKKITDKFIDDILLVLPTSTRISALAADKYMIFINSLGIERSLVVETAQKIKEAIFQLVKINDEREFNQSSTISIALFPKHGNTMKILENSLELANYNAKKTGGGSIKFFSEELRNEKESVNFYYQIKKAIQDNEFYLYYQPIVNSMDDSLIGFETFIRWKHPELGILTPDKFLNIMDQSGDIDFLGLWGVEEIIKTSQILSDEFKDIELIFLMNLSFKQLKNSSLSVDYAKLIKKYNFDSSKIAFEVPEYSLFDKRDSVGDTVKKFKDLGFKIAVDGFELDFQTLNKVESKNISIIKFDKNFLNDEETYMKIHLIELIKQFSDVNKTIIIQEQVEDHNMVVKAQAYGFFYMQGYYYHKPIAYEDLVSLIKKKMYSPNYIDIHSDTILDEGRIDSEITEKSTTLDNNDSEKKEE